MIKGRRLATALLITVAISASSTATAHAGVGNGDGTDRKPTGPGGNSGGKDLMAAVTSTNITISTSSGGSAATGNITPSDPNWTPPPCWYEPVMTPMQFKAGVDALAKPDGMAPSSAYTLWSASMFQDYYENGKTRDGITTTPYKNYNIDKQGKGMWWRGVVNPNLQNDTNTVLCNEFMFWVNNGVTPKYPQAISPQILAGYAYNSIRVPDTKVATNPNGKQTVNLPTWVWLDNAIFKPVSVTASLSSLNMWATTKATPVSLHIDPGTPDAQTFPSSGDCPINSDGSIGTPYSGDANATPPCGLTYRHSTNSAGPYQFKATLTWKISWTGSGNTGGNLPDGTFGTTTPVTVQEIQSVVR